MRVSINRPASRALVWGAKGESPLAIRSAFTNCSMLSVSGRRTVAVVDFPALLEPPRTKISESGIGAHYIRYCEAVNGRAVLIGDRCGRLAK